MEGGLKYVMENRSENLKEEWIKLEEEKIPEGEFYATSFVQNMEGVKISLDDGKFAVEIFFDGVPFLIRQAVEGIRMRTWAEIQTKYDDKSFFRRHFFFLVKNSLLIEWAVEEGCGFYEKDKIIHYCIVTSEELIDILAEFAPSVKVSKIPIVSTK